MPVMMMSLMLRKLRKFFDDLVVELPVISVRWKVFKAPEHEYYGFRTWAALIVGFNERTARTEFFSRKGKLNEMH